MNISAIHFVALFVLLINFRTNAQTLIHPWAKVNQNALIDLRPMKISTDRSGNVFVVYNTNDEVSKISPTGIVTQRWAKIGLYPGNNHDIVIDASGNVYISIHDEKTIVKITSGGLVTQRWAVLDYIIKSTAIDALGNIFTSEHTTNNISSGYNGNVSKISPNGMVNRTWVKLLGVPYHIACDPSRNVFLSEGDWMHKITANGTLSYNWAYNWFGWGDMVIDASGNIYALSRLGVSKVTLSGIVTEQWARISNLFPHNIAIDASGNVYTLNSNNSSTVHNISRIAPSGRITDPFINLPVGSHKTPISIAIDASGNIFILHYDGTISKISTSIVTSINRNPGIPSGNKANIFPNPASTNVIVQFEHAPLKNIFMEFIDNNGIVVKKIQIRNKTSMIDLSSLTNGEYSIRILDKEYKQTIKIVIAR